MASGSKSSGASGTPRLAVLTVTIAQIKRFPVDSNRFEVHGLVVQVDNPSDTDMAQPRRRKYGGKSSLAVVIQKEAGDRITLESLTEDGAFLSIMSKRCALDKRVLVYRPTVASCQYSMTEDAVSLKAVPGLTIITKSEQAIAKKADDALSFAHVGNQRCHRKIVKYAKVRKDILGLSSVTQHDRLQGFSTTRNTQITSNNEIAPTLVEAIGLSYRCLPANDPLLQSWADAIKITPYGSKSTPKLVVGTFIAYRKIDSCGYRCLTCDSPSSRDPVSSLVLCEGSCTEGQLVDAAIEISATADVHFEGGPAVIQAKVYANEFKAVTGAYLESFATQPSEEQLASLNTRFANYKFAMHVRLKQSTGAYEGHVFVNITSLEKPHSPIEAAFGIKSRKMDK